MSVVYPCGVSERTYLMPAVCFNLKCLIQLEYGSMYKFSREFNINENVLNNIVINSTGCPPQYLEIFISLGYLHKDHNTYGISFKDQVRLACIRLIKKYHKLDDWLSTHNIDRISFLLFSEHYQYDEYIIACLKKECLFIDNAHEERLNLPPPTRGNNRRLTRGLARLQRTMPEDEIKLRQSIVNQYGSLKAFYTYTGTSPTRLRNFVGLYLDFKKNNIL